MDIVEADVAFLLKDKVVSVAAEVLNFALQKQPLKPRQSTIFTSVRGSGKAITNAVGDSILNFASRADEVLNRRNQKAVYFKDKVTLEAEVAGLIDRLCSYRELARDTDEVFNSSVLILCHFSTFKQFFKKF